MRWCSGYSPERYPIRPELTRLAQAGQGAQLWFRPIQTLRLTSGNRWIANKGVMLGN